MTDRYVKSGAAGSPNSGSNWSEAFQTLSLAAAGGGAGDRYFVSNNHAESLGAGIGITFLGTNASPNQCICTDDAATPPTALATTASVTTTGANAMTLAGSAYVYGITFIVGSGASSQSNLQIAPTSGNSLVFENCKFRLASTAASSQILAGPTGSLVNTRVEWKNCDVKFGNTGQGITAQRCTFTWRGGTIEAGGSQPNNLFVTADQAGSYLVDSCDFSNGSSSMNLVEQSASFAGRFVFRNCKLPASWTGNPGASQQPNARIEMINCDSADTNYKLWVVDYAGSIKDETAIVLSGGASDGATSLSWKMAAGANASYPTLPLRSPEIIQWVTANGAQKTVSVEIANIDGPGTILKDDEVWLEICSLGPAGSPSAVHPSLCTSTAKANPLSSGTPVSMSTATWNSIGSPGATQKLSATFTPQASGYLIVTVCLAKANQTIYVDPKLTVS